MSMEPSQERVMEDIKADFEWACDHYNYEKAEEIIVAMSEYSVKEAALMTELLRKIKVDELKEADYYEIMI